MGFGFYANYRFIFQNQASHFSLEMDLTTTVENGVANVFNDTR